MVPFNLPTRARNRNWDGSTTVQRAVARRIEQETIASFRRRVGMIMDGVERKEREDGRRKPVRVVAHYNKRMTRVEIKVTTWESFGEAGGMF